MCFVSNFHVGMFSRKCHREYLQECYTHGGEESAAEGVELRVTSVKKNSYKNVLEE